MDDDDIDEITYTNSNQHNRRSLTGTSITSISEDRKSISTLNQQTFEEIVKDDEGFPYFKDQFFE
ncbi:CLUMA_CG011719, isoform A [Clunio marinus]|uniref:CLUMA_CG011719, isoform A n=1 Tax=Clunio marinus TaxID=568069 RepID=A0A1J1IDK2_9DIPT|nr:CLUMA_CG011719, isoform A [Clunio marinus]